ncbi:MAG: DUF488 domain-containing protein [Desulfomicrobium sp.]|jgi:uncharacterized protein YeaO (DUF488 family)|nr:DUF488 domain-containing protein [Desulfomicrobium sp.]NLV95856.1 DUF488 domain-containing protein [Desulfovibrionales bacterium]
MHIAIKRVYEPPGEDGTRILVDRLWPRGLKKEKLLGIWLKDAGPSTELRKWFGHDPQKWTEFKKRYFAELDDHPEVISTIMEFASQGMVTFLYASHEQEYNQAVALREYVESKMG